MKFKYLILLVLFTIYTVPLVSFAKTSSKIETANIEVIEQLTKLLKDKPQLLYELQTIINRYRVDKNDLSVSCNAKAEKFQIGKRIEWVANVSGGTEKYYFEWEGTGGLKSKNQQVSKKYSKAGKKNATVTVKSGVQTITATCEADILEWIAPEPIHRNGSGLPPVSA